MARQSNTDGEDLDVSSQRNHTRPAILSKFAFSTRFSKLTKLFVQGRNKLDVLHNGTFKKFEEAMPQKMAQSLKYTNDTLMELKSGSNALDEDSRRVFKQYFHTDPNSDLVTEIRDRARLIKQGLESRNLTVKLSDHIDLKDPNLPEDHPKPYHYHKPGYMFAFGQGQELLYHRKTGQYFDENHNQISISESELDCPPSFSVYGRCDHIEKKDQVDPKVTIRLNAEMGPHGPLDILIPHEVAHGVAGLNDHFPNEGSTCLTTAQAIDDADTYSKYFRAVSQLRDIRASSVEISGTSHQITSNVNGQRQFKIRDRSGRDL